LAEVRERVTEKLKHYSPAEQLALAVQHSLAAQRVGLKACGPLCAVLSTYWVPVVLRYWLHDYLSGNSDSPWRVGLFGGPGTGKTTYAVLTLAVWYATTRGYCDVRMPEVRGLGDVVPPALDCRVDVMRQPIPELERAVIYNIFEVEKIVEENVRAQLEGRQPPLPAILLDEAGVSSFGALTYFKNKAEYVAAGSFSQLIRTTAPFIIVTAPAERMLSKYLRGVVNVKVYMAVDAQVPGVVNVRIDVATEPRGIYRVEVLELLRDAVLKPGANGVKAPDWFYQRHVQWRAKNIANILKQAKKALQKAAEWPPEEEEEDEEEEDEESEMEEGGWRRRRRWAEYDF